MSQTLLHDFQKILAAENAVQVNLTYCDENGTVVERTIFPYRLTVSRDGNVVVHCYRPGYLNDAGRTVPGAYRHYRLDRMSGVEFVKLNTSWQALFKSISLRQDHPKSPNQSDGSYVAYIQRLMQQHADNVVYFPVGTRSWEAFWNATPHHGAKDSAYADHPCFDTKPCAEPQELDLEESQRLTARREARDARNNGSAYIW
jgi:hypothetical protein